LAPALGLGACGPRPRGAPLVLQQREVGFLTHVADHQQRVARMHALAVVDKHLAHDTAFLVLDGLALVFHLELRRCHHRAGKRCERGPGGEQRGRHRDGQQQAARLALPLACSLALGARIDQQISERAVALCHAVHAATPCAAAAATGSVRTLRASRRPSTVAAGPYACTTPPASTAILSSCAIRPARWPTTITVVPAAFSARSASRSASWPSPSRCASGSSSTTSFGSPYSARASAMRCRWPPDSAAPSSPTGVS